MEAPQCQMAIAAAEAVAAARGRRPPSAPEEPIGWAAQHRALSADLVPLAVAAIDRVTTVSELKELWEETDPEEWRASTAELRQRLG